VQIKHLKSAILFIALILSTGSDLFAQNKADGESTTQAGFQYWLDIDKEAITTESGLQYKVLFEGRGSKPKPRANVSVHYRGLLLDGTQFDHSYDNDEPVRLNLKRVIKGWGEGVQLMSVGSVYVFLIPPELGYGERGAASIPPNSTLIFEIELFKHK
jgi:FKBP-type peptidyl-prolyl cis-trans isomerase